MTLQTVQSVHACVSHACSGDITGQLLWCLCHALLCLAAPHRTLRRKRTQMTDADRAQPAQRPLQAVPSMADLPPAGAWLQSLGMVLDEISGTRVTAHLDLGPQHHTPWGVVHGGIYTTLIESVASVGASAAVFEHEQFAVGVH